MISLKFGLPLVRDEAGKSVAFDMAWLRTTLASAASKAGHHGWWLADDLAEGITMFLRHDYPNSVIDLSKLETEVQTVLTGCRVRRSRPELSNGDALPPDFFGRVLAALATEMTSRNFFTGWAKKSLN